jgi:hypothetical protein
MSFDLFGGKKSKRKKKDDFGLGIANINSSVGFGFGRKPTEKERKRNQLRINQQNGLEKQRLDETRYRMAGYEVTRVRTGYDFGAKSIFPNPFTGKKEHLKVESKNGATAPLRPLQKKEKKKSRNYRVERGNGFF